MYPVLRMLSGVIVFFAGIAAVAAGNPPLVTEEFMVPALDPNISLYVRNKHPEGMSNFADDKILLFVHGATYPSETTFDLKLNGGHRHTGPPG